VFLSKRVFISIWLLEWIREVMGDAELALRIGRMQKNLQGDALRNEIIRNVKARLNEFKVSLQ
jgi:hypothetical protein